MQKEVQGFKKTLNTALIALKEKHTSGFSHGKNA